MIPAIIPPLTGLTLLVTRPAAQSELLAHSVRALGGEALLLPAIDIRSVSAAVSGTHDLVIFVSANAVEHGASIITRSEGMRTAAIGRATAAALKVAGWNADIVPAQGFTSESLLSHPMLSVTPATRILIVRGRGGREILQQAFAAQGCTVDMVDVYERILPTVPTAQIEAIESAWSDGAIDVVTATSVETLRNLQLLLSERGRSLLSKTPLVVPSARVGEAAAEMGLRGDCIIAAGADDVSITGALSLWHARARLVHQTSAVQ